MCVYKYVIGRMRTAIEYMISGMRRNKGPFTNSYRQLTNSENHRNANTVILNPGKHIRITPDTKLLCKCIIFQDNLSYNYVITFYCL